MTLLNGTLKYSKTVFFVDMKRNKIPMTKIYKTKGVDTSPKIQKERSGIKKWKKRKKEKDKQG